MSRSIRPRDGRSRSLGVLLALPATGLMCLFLLWPVVVAGDYSLHEASGYGDKKFVGLDNFGRALFDERFYAALGRNVVYAGIVVVLSIVIGFTLAYLLYLKVKGWRVLQVIFMIPYITPAIVIALLWQFMLEPTGGLVNSVLRGIGLDSLAGPWLTGESTSLITVSLVQTWHTVPLALLLIFIQMVAMDSEMLEAAELDGAGHIRRMLSIVLPSVRPAIVLVAILLTLQLFRSFDLVYILTQGGPIGSSTIATLYVYVTAFANNEYGYANALGILLGIVLVLLSVVVRTLSRVRARRGALEGGR